MTLLPKSATIGGTINLGNYDNFRFEFGAEIASSEDYLELVRFTAGSLIGQFRTADENTQTTIRAYVARLCSIEEEAVPCLGSPAPETPAPETPPVTTPEPVPQPPKPAPAPPTLKPGEEVCEKCGAPVPKSQAKLSMLFQSKTLCKPCMDKSQGAS
jgi:hypothetical protein